MRGKVKAQKELMYLIDLETLVDEKHPIREVRALCRKALAQLGDEFEGMYSKVGRPSVPPERLLMAWVLMALYSVRSCRMLAEQLRYNLLFKWFLDMNPDEGAFDASTFSKNMERLISNQVSEGFFATVVKLARERGWVSDEHFSVDGTLIESWASLKSFRPKGEPPQDGNGWADFKGQKRSNQTHESQTDPEAKLMRKGAGREAKLCFGAHSTIENRNGLMVMLEVRPACGAGHSEPQVALEHLQELPMRGFSPRSVGADKGYHTKDFVEGCRKAAIAPHVAMIEGRKTPGLDGRTTRTQAYRISQIVRRRVEEPFGWMKTVGLFRRSRWRGVARTHFAAQMVGAACNLMRMAKLSMGEAQAPPATAAA